MNHQGNYSDSYAKNIGILSKSGTLTYEAIDQIIKEGYGVSVGIGGDQIIGSDMIDILELFNKDDDTSGIVIIGEIGGTMEVDAARWIKEYCNKPVVGFIAGQTTPGRRMGHAGAIVSGGDETAEAKMNILEECGVTVCKTVADIGKNMKMVLKGYIMNNRTFAIIKPDAVKNKYTGLIYDEILKADFKILSSKLIKMTKKQAEHFYMIHKDRPLWRTH